MKLKKNIVTPEFVKRKDVYNSSIGGKGGNLNLTKTPDEIKKISEKRRLTMDKKKEMNPDVYKECLSKTNEHKRKISESNKRCVRKESHKENIRVANKKRKELNKLNPQPGQCTNKKYKIVDPKGKEYITNGNLMILCKELNLSYKTLHVNIDKGIIKTKRHPYSGRNSLNGWSISSLSLSEREEYQL